MPGRASTGSDERIYTIVGESNAKLSSALCSAIRKAFEELIEAECHWREYEFMIAGNVSVANQQDAGHTIVERWKALLKETRGSAAELDSAPNRRKWQRAQEFSDEWRARLEDTDTSAETMEEHDKRWKTPEILAYSR